METEQKGLNVYLLTQNKKLKSDIESKEKTLNIVTNDILKIPEDKNDSIDILFIDGQLTSHNSISDIRTILPNAKILFLPHQVKSSDALRNIGIICSGYRVSLLKENMSTSQIADEIIRESIGSVDERVTKVVSLFGTHSGAGLSTTVMNIARVLAYETKSNVGVLSLNAWDTADYFHEYGGAYLNEIKTDLSTKSLTKDKLKKLMNHRKQFWQLAGNKDIKLQRYYTVEEIEYLIELARETFDIVLIDSGCHFDNACYAQSFLSSDMKFLVTNQDIKGFRNYWTQIRDQILNPMHVSESEYLLIVNNYVKNYNLISDKNIAEELGMHLLTTIPSEGELGNISLRNYKSLYDVASNQYKESLNVIADSLINSCGLTRAEKVVTEEKKKGLFNFFKKKEEAW